MGTPDASGTPPETGGLPPPGALAVVATPLGNLGDWTERARRVLAAADRILCEDTRVCARLLRSAGIEPEGRLLSCHEGNESARLPGILGELESGRRVALVADAGTPAISDPGFRVVRACRRAGLPVLPVPGASALTAALAVSGLPTDRFYFVGFLPPRSAARRRFLEEHRTFPATIVLYESVHRIEKLLGECVDLLGPERILAVAREMTKKHESYAVGPAAEVRDKVLAQARKGEYVVLLAPESFRL